jgi:integrase|tara:strand:- start:141 stop:1406 length:1266 start_codon:yes stop_codon:yes gene_type:complete
LGIYLRGTIYWFEKRVPAALKKALKQTLYRVSLDTSSKSLATARGLKADIEIKAEWSAIKEALAGGPKGEYEKANQRAVTLGLTYTDVSNLKGNPKAIAERALAIGPDASKEDVIAAFGLAPKPSLMLSQMCEVNEELVQFDIRQKSPDQMRKWRVQRTRAANNLIAVVGDMPLDQFTREHALTFREWWRKRIEVEGLQANTANKDLTCLQGMWRSINDRKMMGLPDLWAKTSFRHSKASKTRPPFSSGWIRDRILSEGSLSGLNDEARDVFLICINTGMRPSEVCNLRKDQILVGPDVNIPYVSVEPVGREVKSGRAVREIPLVGVSLEAMRRNLDGFPRYRDNDNFSALVNKYLRKNGLAETPEHTVYSLRHSFGDRLTNHGATERVDRDLMGHRLSREEYGDGASLETKLEVLEAISF